MQIRYIVYGVLGLFALITTFNTLYIVPEGHVTVVKHLGKAVRQEGPGLQIKIPYIQTTERIEVRERKNVEKMAAATRNQLPAVATVSINWTVNKEAAIDLYIQYGGLAQFEERVLDPRMRSAAKAAIAHYRADEIIRDRQKVVAEIQAEIVAVTKDLPITITMTQLENIILPTTYMDAILAKEKAREDAAREQHNLNKQKLVAQQKVQTAEAERDAVKARADGTAYQKRTIADADAYQKRIGASAESFRVKTEYTGRSEGIELLKAQLTPEYINYLRAQGWDGVLPKTMLGSGTNVLFSLGAAMGAQK